MKDVVQVRPKLLNNIIGQFKFLVGTGNQGMAHPIQQDLCSQIYLYTNNSHSTSFKDKGGGDGGREERRSVKTHNALSR